ncbi:MAG: hypothetical protein JWO07_751 [Candidatus Saccharibacteria bacterium]|nr:hypothetical protein [Candidatus Saccharibacteria bacterium]
MKKQVFQSVQTLLKDRYLTWLLAGFLLLCLLVLVYLAFAIHASELQVVVHYTSFGTTNFYRDKWYYLLTFVAFVLVMAVSHSVITYKLLEKKGRDFAVSFVWLSVLLILIATALFYQVLKIASLS